MPLNMLDDIPILDAPEGESLAFQNMIDAFRQFSGPAHLAGKTIISSECGAVSGAPYTQTLGDLLWSVNRGLSGGVSTHVLHGYAYSGSYANTTWPSYTTFTYMYTDMWNPNQPAWQHMKDSIDYIARNQYISQIGKPKIDVAFYQHSSPWITSVQYDNDNLETLGYTYEYLSSGSLESPNATVMDGVLAPTGPAYKALIFSNRTSLTAGAATRIERFAAAGLPIIFIGASDFASIGSNAGETENVTATIKKVMQNGRKNVQTIDSAEQLPQVLAAVGVLPSVYFSTKTARWFTFWRRTDDMDYVFVYNDAENNQASDVSFAVDESAIPFNLDAWTGRMTPVIQYTAYISRIKIPITLKSNETTIIGFSRSNVTSLPAEIPRFHVTNSTGAIAGFTYRNSSVVAQLTGPASITLSNGVSKNFTTCPPPASNLSSWNISIQDWHATSNRFSMETAVTYHDYTNKTLAPWSKLSTALADVSGIGTYTTTFSFPSASQNTRLGAILHLGPVTNTVRAWVNGVRLAPIDLSNAVADITGLVTEGKSNELRVEVTTTLFNRVKADRDFVRSAGDMADSANGGYYAKTGRQEYGLLGPVFVEWIVLEEVL
ncbi:hypothetical protein K490DRAFT_69886 [Saccharata proteae CBS 121410]|uniref:Uncharacterized protein n=1 Tax=Saccharata proteae CBS 121410 TaxID=1314787 RepID=A0A9P4LVU2_9PEZI|nr:hypothetical protein K490DRAFT_69886 [Saccharata proteae CBS 121410]